MNIDDSVLDVMNQKATEYEGKFQNWQRLCKEMDKVGISIEEKDQELMAKGNKEKIVLAFSRIERFLTKIAGAKIFEFEGLKNTAPARSPTNKGPLKQKTIEKLPSPKQLEKQKTKKELPSGVSPRNLPPKGAQSPTERQKTDMKNMQGASKNNAKITQSSSNAQLMPNASSQKTLISPIASPDKVSFPENKSALGLSMNESPAKKNQSQILSKISLTDKANGPPANKRGSKPNQKKGTKEAVDILKMEVTKLPNETESSLELLLNTLCRSCEMKPKQAAALLTNGNQYLIHSVVKGIKGFHQPLVSWFQELYANSHHLSLLVQQETEEFPESANCQKVLGTISSGMYSTRDNLEIIQWCLRVLNKLCEEMSVNIAVIDQAYKWFTDKEGGFELCLHSLSNHSIGDIGEDIVSLITHFIMTSRNSGERFLQIYRERFQKYYTSPELYLAAINEMLPYLISKCKDELLKTDILSSWIDIAVRQSDNQAALSVEEKIPTVSFLAELWYHFTSFIDQRGNELSSTLLAVLRKLSREKSATAKIIAVSLMFRLLDKFALEKNISAPLIYKSLIFTMIESSHDKAIREHYLKNFSYLFQTVPSIPIGLLVDPLLKAMQRPGFAFSTFDFDFFHVLTSHPKYSQPQALTMLDLLSKLFFLDPLNAGCVQSTVLDIFGRFLPQEGSLEQPFHDLFLKFVQVGLNSLMELERAGAGSQALAVPNNDQQRGRNMQNSRVVAVPVSKSKKPNPHEEGLRVIKKARIITVIQNMLYMRSELFNQQVKSELMSVGKDFYGRFGYNNKGIIALLGFFSETPLDLLPSPKKAGRNHSPAAHNSVPVTGQSPDLLALVPAEQASPTNQSGDQMAVALYNPDTRRILNEPGLLALPAASTSEVRSTKIFAKHNVEELDKLRKRKVDQEELKKLDEDKKRAASSKKKKRLQDMLEKRKAELGIASMRRPLVEGSKSLKPAGDSLQALIYENGAIEQEAAKQKIFKLVKQDIQLLDLSDEELRDQEAIKAVMKKYSKLWKNLFHKYANTGYSMKARNFDQMGEKMQMINQPEMVKLLKDHGMLPQFLTKEELGCLYKLINMKLAYGRPDFTTIDYPGYLFLIPQLAFLCFGRPPKDLTSLPLVESLLTLILVFRESARSRGLSVILYEDPEYAAVGDTQLIKALNEKMRSDPQYPIPEGFMKVVEKTPVYEYKIPADIAKSIKESQVVSIEVLDSLVNTVLGFHFLEPLVSFEDFPKVKPVLNAIKPLQAEALTLMNKAAQDRKARADSKDVLAKPEGGDPISSSQSALLLKRPESEHFRPKLNLTLKLEVANTPLAQRPHIQEVAEVMEEMLTLLHDKPHTIGPDTHLPPRANRNPGRIINEAKKHRAEQERAATEMREAEEGKRKRRKEQLKKELEKLKEGKVKEEEEKKKKEEEEAKKEKKEKKVVDQEVKKRADEIKKKIEETKKAKTEEEEKKKKEQVDKEIKEKEERKKAAKDFFKHQKDRLVAEFEQIAKDRDAVQEKKQEIKQMEKDQFRRLKETMENYIKENAGVAKEATIRENTQIAEFLGTEDVVEVFNKYDSSLRHMYKFYAAQDKLDWQEHNKENMNLREFVRFSYQHRIIPALIERPDDIVKLFKHSVKAEGGNQLQLNFEGFKKCLIRVAVLAQDQIGGQKEDLLAARLKVITGEVQEEQAKKDKVRKQQENKEKKETKAHEELKNQFTEHIGKTKKNVQLEGNKIYQDMPEERKYEINENLKAQEEAFFRKWAKVRENKRAAMVTPSTDKPRGSSLSKNANDSQLSIGTTPKVRKTKETRQLKDLQAAEQQVKGLSVVETQVEEAKKVKVIASVKGEFDIHIVSATTIENLLLFLGLVAHTPHLYEMDKNLNQYRIDVQGQKPNKVIKQASKADMMQKSMRDASPNTQLGGGSSSLHLNPSKPALSEAQKSATGGSRPGSIAGRAKSSQKASQKSIVTPQSKNNLSLPSADNKSSEAPKSPKIVDLPKSGKADLPPPVEQKKPEKPAEVEQPKPLEIEQPADKIQPGPVILEQPSEKLEPAEMKIEEPPEQQQQQPPPPSQENQADE